MVQNSQCFGKQYWLGMVRPLVEHIYRAPSWKRRRWGISMYQPKHRMPLVITSLHCECNRTNKTKLHIYTRDYPLWSALKVNIKDKICKFFPCDKKLQKHFQHTSYCLAANKKQHITEKCKVRKQNPSN